jgi:hypothetical protein
MAEKPVSKPVVRSAIKAWNTAQQQQLHHLQAALQLKREMEYLDKIINDGYAVAS